MATSTLQFCETMITILREDAMTALETHVMTWVRTFDPVVVNGVELVIENVVTGVQVSDDCVEPLDTLISVSALGGYGFFVTPSVQQAARQMSYLVSVLGGF